MQRLLAVMVLLGTYIAEMSGMNNNAPTFELKEICWGQADTGGHNHRETYKISGRCDENTDLTVYILRQSNDVCAVMPSIGICSCGNDSYCATNGCGDLTSRFVDKHMDEIQNLEGMMRPAEAQSLYGLLQVGDQALNKTSAELSEELLSVINKLVNEHTRLRSKVATDKKE